MAKQIPLIDGDTLEKVSAYVFSQASDIAYEVNSCVDNDGVVEALDEAFAVLKEQVKNDIKANFRVESVPEDDEDEEDERPNLEGADEDTFNDDGNDDDC